MIIQDGEIYSPVSKPLRNEECTVCGDVYLHLTVQHSGQVGTFIITVEIHIDEYFNRFILQLYIKVKQASVIYIIVCCV